MDELWSLKPFNHRPLHASRVIGCQEGPDFFLSYLDCGHSLLIEDGSEPPERGTEIGCFKCSQDPPIVPVGSA